MKVLALVLGPSGIGLFGYYQAAAGLMGTITSLGVTSSGVRDVAEAHASGDGQRLARTVLVLRRACLVTAFLGLAVATLLAWPLSLWSFGSAHHAGAIALLGLALAAAALSGGQTAYLQGLRRIGDLARINILSAIVGTAAAVACYLFFGERGVALSLVVLAWVTLGCSWAYVRRAPAPSTSLPWFETWTHARMLLRLGVAFMWSGLLTTGIALLTRALIMRDLGVEANGIYQSAWSISGLFAGFVLGAMGADFYPRLTAVAGDNVAANRLVNEQTEIGLLLALPGLVGTLAFGPLIMRLLYSAQFVGGAALLPWFALGVLGRVLSWPLGFLVLAKGSVRWYAITETVGNGVGLIATVVLLRAQGLIGVALAFTVLYVFYTGLMLAVGWRLGRFRWSLAVGRLISFSGVLIGLSFLAQGCLESWLRITAGVGLTAIAVSVSVRGIVLRLGEKSSISLWVTRLGLARLLCVNQAMPIN